MINEYFKLIKELRIEKKYSQEDISKKLGISRGSYISFEKGEKELTFSQIVKITELFGINLEQVENGLKPNYEKYKEMILAYLRQENSINKDLLKTKLAKMLYLADFSWFYENLKSMSGMQYRHIKYGPVPDIYFRAIDDLEESGKITINRKNEMILISENRGSKKQELKELSKEELNLINKIFNKWKDKKTNEIVDFTHNQLPYKLCEDNEIIPYELIIQEDPDYVY